MKHLLFVPLLIGWLLGGPDLDSIRNSYFSANSAEGSAAFLALAENCDTQNALCMTYRGASLAMSAGFSGGVMDRWSLFHDGKDLIEKGVENDPQNAEIRFIRYCIQANCPGILFYSGDLEEDFTIVLEYLKSNPEDLHFWKRAAQAMMDSERTTAEQRTELKTVTQNF